MVTKLMNKMPVRIVAAALLALCASLAQAETRWLDRIVAIVDEDIILASEMDARVEAVKANIARAGKTPRRRAPAPGNPRPADPGEYPAANGRAGRSAH